MKIDSLAWPILIFLASVTPAAFGGTTYTQIYSTQTILNGDSGSFMNKNSYKTTDGATTLYNQPVVNFPYPGASPADIMFVGNPYGVFEASATFTATAASSSDGTYNVAPVEVTGTSLGVQISKVSCGHNGMGWTQITFDVTGCGTNSCTEAMAFGSAPSSWSGFSNFSTGMGNVTNGSVSYPANVYVEYGLTSNTNNHSAMIGCP